MSFIQPQTQLLALKNVETNFGKRQPCMNCSTLTWSRFEVCNPVNSNIFRLLCSTCAEKLTGYDKLRMDVVDKYITSTKSRYRDLRNLAGKFSPKPPNPKVRSYFNLEIGEKKIFITEFHSGRFMMMINDERITPEADFQSFKNQKQVTARAFGFVNNYYIDCILHFIINGVPFKMP